MQWSPVLLLHITGGMVGLLSGAAAMTFRKGSHWHATAGNAFVASMLLMSAAATYLAIVKDESANVLGGVFTFYLITTAWLTARRKDGKPGIFDWAALIIVAPIGVVVLAEGLKKALGAAPHDGVPTGMNFFLGSIILLAVVGDMRMLKHGGIFGRQRITRHLWRMCFGFFIATGSFFLSQAFKLFPPLTAVRGLLVIPAILPLLLLMFWLVRVRFTSLYPKPTTNHSVTNRPMVPENHESDRISQLRPARSSQM